MGRKSKRTKSSAAPGTAPLGAGQAEPPPAADSLEVGKWQERKGPLRRPFPGPRIAGVRLRVACDAAAYSEFVVHAKQSLDAEICGVLVGRVCEDDEGLFVHVQAVVRGEAAKEGSAHVTYTQETWNAVHAVIEREYSDLSIVGWYHSHPGFGVEFSDMDRFIQQNFFSGPCQIGLVTDPLGGDVALCFNAADGIEYLDRFWIDGREQRCRVPKQFNSSTVAGTTAAGNDSVELRLAQLVQAVDDLRASLYRWLMVLGMAAALVVALLMARQIFLIAFGERPDLPKNVGFANIPVKVDGEACLLGVQIVKWKVPPELLVIPPELLEQSAKEREAAETKRDTRDTSKPPGP